MEKHKIELEGLVKFQSEEKIVYASSWCEDKNEDKKLYVTLRGNYEVWSHNEKVFETIQPFNAVEKYNSL